MANATTVQGPTQERTQEASQLPSPKQRLATARRRLQDNSLLVFELLWAELDYSRLRVFALEQEVHQLRCYFQQHGHLDGKVMVPTAIVSHGANMGTVQTLGNNSVPEWVRQVEMHK